MLFGEERERKWPNDRRGDAHLELGRVIAVAAHEDGYELPVVEDPGRMRVDGDVLGAATRAAKDHPPSV